MSRLKVYIDESSWTQIELSLTTTAEEICSYLDSKYKVSNEKEDAKRTLYLTLNTNPRIPLKQKLLRKVPAHESILLLRASLNRKESPHDFYGLFPSVTSASNEPKPIQKKPATNCNLRPALGRQVEFDGRTTEVGRGRERAGQLQAGV